LKLAAFLKCYMDDLCVHHTMTFFDWIAIARNTALPMAVVSRHASSPRATPCSMIRLIWPARCATCSRTTSRASAPKAQ
jgi:hypothetical protein